MSGTVSKLLGRTYRLYVLAAFLLNVCGLLMIALTFQGWPSTWITFGSLWIVAGSISLTHAALWPHQVPGGVAR